jgi:hypothetical protein
MRRITNEPDDPIIALEAIGNVRRWLDQREYHFVTAAREEGRSWQGIGEALGRSRQAVWQRYRNPSDPSDVEFG